MIQRTAPRRSRLQRLAVAALLGFALVGLSQCRSVSDQVTGLSLETPRTLSTRSSCAHRCNSQFKAAVVAEQLRYIAAKRSCGRGWACKKGEERIHAQNLARILDRKRHCKRTCYNEGAGNSGA